MSYDAASDHVTIGNASAEYGGLILTGPVTSSFFTGSFVGDGSGLTGLSGVGFPFTGSAEISGTLAILGQAGHITASGGISSSKTVFAKDIKQIGAVSETRLTGSISGSISGDGTGLFRVGTLNTNLTGSLTGSSVKTGTITNASTVANTKITGSLSGSFSGSLSGSITGSLIGTSSHAVTASHATTVKMNASSANAVRAIAFTIPNGIFRDSNPNDFGYNPNTHIFSTVNISASNAVTASSFTGSFTGSFSGVTATPAGSDKQIQFNDGGNLGADAGFIFDDGLDASLFVGGPITSSGNISSSAGTVTGATGSFAGGLIINNGKQIADGISVFGAISSSGNMTANSFIGTASHAESSSHAVTALSLIHI